MHSKAREKLAASPASDALANNDIIERIRAIEQAAVLRGGVPDPLLQESVAPLDFDVGVK